ncbi:MAG: NifB/NifX family molybdenum-iron cluster-binding protein [Thermodesulfobacteriota bacterium]|nr:NifB/NifX family molybdenum-iron cluster-binding protein [Thermodesulfobacteriota bacterium]
MMNTFIVAIGLDKQGEISCTHFGDSEEILYAEVMKGSVRLLEKNVNPVMEFDEEKHGDQAKLNAAHDILGNATIIVAGKMSPNFRQMRKKKDRMPIVSARTLDETLDYLKASLEEIIAYFDDPENIYLKI